MSHNLEVALITAAYAFAGLLAMGAVNTLIVTIQDIRDMIKFW